ncbi:MAG: hypothetical protein M1549_00650 [Candidatus Dependentiae bacterium]|nr:hypothetical protein [Candidatus Dependentiae bacterium]
MKRTLLPLALLAIAGSQAARAHLEANVPKGLSNPAQTCWLNATITLMFSCDSAPYRWLKEQEKSKDPFTSALRNFVKAMHDPQQPRVSFKDEKGEYGPLWRELKKGFPSLSYDVTDEDGTALEQISKGLSSTSPDFREQFGAQAFGKLFGKKLPTPYLELYEVPEKVDNKTVSAAMENSGFASLEIKGSVVPPRVIWIRCPTSNPKTPIKCSRILQFTNLPHAETEIFYGPSGTELFYNFAGMTLYRMYKSDPESEDEKVHYGSLVHCGQDWYVIDDGLVQKLVDKVVNSKLEIEANIQDLFEKGLLTTTHRPADLPEIKTTWYPSILQYALWGPWQEIKKFAQQQQISGTEKLEKEEQIKKDEGFTQKIEQQEKDEELRKKVEKEEPIKKDEEPAKKIEPQEKEKLELTKRKANPLYELEKEHPDLFGVD